MVYVYIAIGVLAFLFPAIDPDPLKGMQNNDLISGVYFGIIAMIPLACIFWFIAEKGYPLLYHGSIVGRLANERFKSILDPKGRLFVRVAVIGILAAFGKGIGVIVFWDRLPMVEILGLELFTIYLVLHNLASRRSRL